MFGGNFPVQQAGRLGTELAERIVSGGYPPALARPAGRSARNWYRNYIDAQVQRDIGALSRIRSLDALPRLLAVAATQTAQLFNVSRLAGPFSLASRRSAITLRCWSGCTCWRGCRRGTAIGGNGLVKTPKLHIGDTGLACALLGATAPSLLADRSLLGQLLETFVFQELRRQATWYVGPVEFFHYRDKDQVEVDIVMESGSRVAGVEVKAGATVTVSDFRGLRRLKDACGERFAAGVVLYDGETSVGFRGRPARCSMRLLWKCDESRVLPPRPTSHRRRPAGLLTTPVSYAGTIQAGSDPWPSFSARNRRSPSRTSISDTYRIGDPADGRGANDGGGDACDDEERVDQPGTRR